MLTVQREKSVFATKMLFCTVWDSLNVAENPIRGIKEE